MATMHNGWLYTYVENEYNGLPGWILTALWHFVQYTVLDLPRVQIYIFQTFGNLIITVNLSVS